MICIDSLPNDILEIIFSFISRECRWGCTWGRPTRLSIMKTQKRWLTVSRHIFYPEVSLYYACVFNNVNILKELLNDSRITFGIKTSFPEACASGHIDVVKECLKSKKLNPNDYENYALRAAIVNNRIRVVEELLKDSRVKIPLIMIHLAYLHSIDITIILLNDRRVKEDIQQNVNIHFLRLKKIIENEIKLQTDIKTQIINGDELSVHLLMVQRDIKCMICNSYATHRISAVCSWFLCEECLSRSLRILSFKIPVHKE